jgi:ribosomal protein S18 acetylase RimI-like enzyme
MEDLTCRKATPDDLPQLFELWWELQTQHEEYNPIWYGPLSREECLPLVTKRFAEAIADKNSVFVVAEHDEKVVGMLRGIVRGRPPVLKQITNAAVELAVVTKEYRRKGIFAALMKLFETDARERGASVIGLSVASVNVEAVKAYESRGYNCEQLGMRKWL